MHWHEMTLVGFFCAQNQCRVFLPQVFSWQKSSVVCRIFSLHAGAILLCTSSLSATQFLETVPQVLGTLATNFNAVLY